jgi:hypothetical protein
MRLVGKRNFIDSRLSETKANEYLKNVVKLTATIHTCGVQSQSAWATNMVWREGMFELQG